MAEKCTYPKHANDGMSTRGKITSNMSNNPKGGAFKPDFYSGKKGMAKPKK